MIRKLIYILLPIAIILIMAILSHGKPDKDITLSNDDITLSFDIEEVPVIEEYLSQEIDIETEIDRMILRYLDEIDGYRYYLIRYTGGIKMGSYVVVREADYKLESLPIEDFGVYGEYKESGDGRYLACYFLQTAGRITRGAIRVVDTKEFKVYNGPQNTIDDIVNYKTHISDYRFTDDNRLEIQVPDIVSHDYEDIDKWYTDNDKKLKKIKINFMK